MLGTTLSSAFVSLYVIFHCICSCVYFGSVYYCASLETVVVHVPALEQLGFLEETSRLT